PSPRTRSLDGSLEGSLSSGLRAAVVDPTGGTSPLQNHRSVGLDRARESPSGEADQRCPFDHGLGLEPAIDAPFLFACAHLGVYGAAMVALEATRRGWVTNEPPRML